MSTELLTSPTRPNASPRAISRTLTDRASIKASETAVQPSKKPTVVSDTPLESLSKGKGKSTMKPGPAAEPVPKGKGSASARRSTKVVVDAPATPTTRPTTLVPLLASDQPGRQSTLQVRRAQDLDPQYRRISALAGGLSPRQGASVSVAASQAGAVTRSPDRLAPISALEAGAAFVSAPAGARPLPPGFVYDKCGCVKRDPASWRMFPPRKHWPCREPQAEAQAQLRGPCRSVSVRRRVPSP